MIRAGAAAALLALAGIALAAAPIAQAKTQRKRARPKPPRRAPAPRADAVSGVYYRNCAEARAAGAAPIRRGEPGYRPPLDRDDDGIACEPYGRYRP